VITWNHSSLISVVKLKTSIFRGEHNWRFCGIITRNQKIITIANRFDHSAFLSERWLESVEYLYAFWFNASACFIWLAKCLKYSLVNHLLSINSLLLQFLLFIPVITCAIFIGTASTTSNHPFMELFDFLWSLIEPFFIRKPKLWNFIQFWE